MLNVKVDKRDPTDLYEQVAGEIRRAIAEGEAKPGERLPPARDLAAVLGVNTNTVLRSLRLLRDEGLLEFRRGRGISVAGTPERGAVVQRARELVEFARHQGYRLDELVEIIEDVWLTTTDDDFRARELPSPPLEEALQLVDLYAVRGSSKYEQAALRWLERYLTEGSPRLRHFAEIAANLAELDAKALP